MYSASIIYVVESRLGNPTLSIQSLANQIRISERRCRRLCRSSLGMPFRRYARLIRLHRAADLLTTSPLSIKAIAGRVGYCTSSHLYAYATGLNKVSDTVYPGSTTHFVINSGYRNPAAERQAAL